LRAASVQNVKYRLNSLSSSFKPRNCRCFLDCFWEDRSGQLNSFRYNLNSVVIIGWYGRELFYSTPGFGQIKTHWLPWQRRL